MVGRHPEARAIQKTIVDRFPDGIESRVVGDQIMVMDEKGQWVPVIGSDGIPFNPEDRSMSPDTLALLEGDTTPAGGRPGEVVVDKP